MMATRTLPSSWRVRPFELPLVVDMRSSKNQLLTDVQDALNNSHPRGRGEKIDGPLQAAPRREYKPCRDHDDTFGARAESDIAAQPERLRLRAHVRHEEGARDCGDREHDRDVVAFTREHKRDCREHRALADAVGCGGEKGAEHRRLPPDTRERAIEDV